MQTWNSQASHPICPSSCLRYSNCPYRGLFRHTDTHNAAVESLPAHKPGPFLFLPCRVDMTDLTPRHLLQRPLRWKRKTREKPKLYPCTERLSPLISQHRSRLKMLTILFTVLHLSCEVFSDSLKWLHITIIVTANIYWVLIRDTHCSMWATFVTANSHNPRVNRVPTLQMRKAKHRGSKWRGWLSNDTAETDLGLFNITFILPCTAFIVIETNLTNSG